MAIPGRNSQGAGRGCRRVPGPVAGGLAGGKQHRDTAGRRARDRDAESGRRGPGRDRHARLPPPDLVRRGPLAQPELHRPGGGARDAAGQPHLPRPARPPGSGHLRDGRRRQDRDRHRVHSPAPGRVRHRLVDPGRTSRPGPGSAGQPGRAAGIAVCHVGRPGPGHRGGAGSAGVGNQAELAAGLRQRRGATGSAAVPAGVPTCRCSTSSPIAATCTAAIRRCAASSSTRYGGCTCAAATPRRPGSGKMPSGYGASGSARRTSRC